MKTITIKEWQLIPWSYKGYFGGNGLQTYICVNPLEKTPVVVFSGAKRLSWLNGDPPKKTTVRYVEFVEPWGADPKGVATIRIKEQDAINYQKRAAAKARPDFFYKDDKDALMDFMTIHWAHMVEQENDMD